MAQNVTITFTKEQKKAINAQALPLSSKIAKAEGISKSEAYAKARAQLEAELIAKLSTAVKKVAPQAEKPAKPAAKKPAVKPTGAKRGRPAENHPVIEGATMEQVIEILSARNANITYVNNRGNKETTRATMVEAHFPTTRKALGRREPKGENQVTFYDVRHGVFRTMSMDKFVSIQ